MFSGIKGARAAFDESFSYTLTNCGAQNNDVFIPTDTEFQRIIIITDKDCFNKVKTWEYKCNMLKIIFGILLNFMLNSIQTGV